MTTRIVFLDMDGVMCSPRAALALGDHGLIRAIDPVAVQFLNRLYATAPYRLVGTSTWRRETYMPLVLKAVGCVAPFHEQWRTGDRGALGMRSRPAEIAEWLIANGPVDEYIILDDDGFLWQDEQIDRWVRCDSYNGISLDGMRKAMSLFAVADWPQAIGRSHGYDHAAVPRAAMDWEDPR